MCNEVEIRKANFEVGQKVRITKSVKKLRAVAIPRYAAEALADKTGTVLSRIFCDAIGDGFCYEVLANGSEIPWAYNSTQLRSAERRGGRV